MVFASYKRLLYLYFSWKLTMASDNVIDNSSPATSNETQFTAALKVYPEVKTDNSSPATSNETQSTAASKAYPEVKTDIKIQQLGDNILRISCGVTSGSSVGVPLLMSIFADTSNNMLANVAITQCPKILDSANEKYIYIPKCVQHEKNMFLDIVLTNYNPTGNQQLGCDYMYMVDRGQILHSLSLATFPSPETSSSAASNETESPTTQGGCPEVKEGTPSSTVRDDTLIDDHGGTCERHGNCRRLSSSGKTAQAQSKTYTPMKISKKPDNYDECTVVIEADLPGDFVNTRKRILLADSSPVNVNNKEEYQDDNPYTQVKK